MADSSIEFELERAYDRDELAAVFREFAAALAENRPLRLDDGERTAAIAIPPRVVAEFEAERDADESPPVAELELELEWDDPDGSSLRLADSERETSGVGTGEGTATGEAEADSATATMPPDAVAGQTDSEDERNDAAAPVTDPGSERDRDGGRTSRFEVYEDRANEWRWRLVHWNGNIVADSGEGYTSRSNAKRAARSVMRSAPAASIEERES